MTVDVSTFQKLNVADTCSIWNLLSSWTLYRKALASECSFCCTTFVVYECLHKKRTISSEGDEELKDRLVKEFDADRIKSCGLGLEDLQDVEVLKARRNLGKGELTSIIFAKKTRQAFLTDDQKARKLAKTELGNGHVQTVPHLLGWLLYHRLITDGDKDVVIREHVELGRPLEKHFEKIHWEAMRCMNMSREMPNYTK